jgi:hypothetical protein
MLKMNKAMDICAASVMVVSAAFAQVPNGSVDTNKATSSMSTQSNSPLPPVGLPLEQVTEFQTTVPHVRIHHKRRRELDESIEELNEESRERRQHRNHEIERQFQEVNQAGGWPKVFLSQIEQARRDLPGSEEQLNAAQAFLEAYIFCRTPQIAQVTSKIEMTGAAPNIFNNIFTVEKDSVVEPQATVIIDGCRFCPDVGQVQPILSQDSGGPRSLSIKLVE